MQPVQNRLKPFPCTCCSKSFRSSNGLKKHLEKVHPQDDLMDMRKVCSHDPGNNKPSKSIPPALDLSKKDEDFSQGILAEFAFIATGPQSPLVQEVNGCGNESPCDPRDIDYNIPSVESDVSAYSPPLDPPTYRYATPPPTAWSCFLDGTRIQLEGEEEWKYAEDLGNDDIPHVCNPSDGLRLMSCERLLDVDDDEREYYVTSFHSTSADQPSLRAEVAGDHPFYAKGRGWCSFQPDRTLSKYGILCHTLAPSDVCLPSSHPDVMRAIREGSSNMFDFTYSDSNAVLTLNSMLKDYQEHRSRQTKLGMNSVKSRVTKSPAQLQQLNKRPMNAFMLFAKRYRPEITQAHPGKDNRAISVILGDTWKNMEEEEREQYVKEAKLLAEEHKKVNPDCWKRKRSGSQGRTKSSLKLKRL